MIRTLTALAFAAMTVPAALALTAAPAEAGDWKRCTQEGGYCNPSDYFTKIRYGVGDRWIEVDGTSAMTCANHDFGGDPMPGRRKYCEVYVPNWETCTQEGGYCRTQGSHAVRYGVDPHGRNTYVEKSTAGRDGITCANHDFGRDPAPSRRKYCWIFK